MEKVNVDKYVIMIKDIITEEEADFLIKMAQNATEEEWDAYRKSLGPDADSVNAAYGDWTKQMLWLQLNPHLFAKAQNLVESINSRCIHIINDHYQTNYSLDPLYNIYKFRDGDYMKEHHDSGLSPDIRYGAVVYLNDNFDGGEIYYPKANLEIKPIARSLVVHPAGMIYRHGVRTVRNGERFSLAGFVRINQSQS
jgi:Rps23 Pro-64 3,4-dihydroxylase Tpa1-like proline 4-hydroxylase